MTHERTDRADVQTIRDSSGKPAFAVLPMPVYEDLLERARAAGSQERGLVPHEVVNLMFEGRGMSTARAWREHLGLTQAEVARRMGVSQAALAQTEAAARPRKATLEKLATALGLRVEQLLV